MLPTFLRDINVIPISVLNVPSSPCVDHDPTPFAVSMFPFSCQRLFPLGSGWNTEGVQAQLFELFLVCDDPLSELT
jgi:hypothetical protein